MKNRDLGNDDIKKLLVQLCLPAVLAMLVNMLYNIVDRIYIGHIADVGAAALTGVGLFLPILTLITAFALLVGQGGAPRAAIAMGQNDRERANRILGNSLTMLLTLSVILTVVFYRFLPELLTLFGASENTLPYGLAYGRIYVLGTVLVMMVMGLNPFISAQGFAAVSMLTIVIGAVCNIVLDPVFIFALGLGVRGAAIATVISQAVSAVWILAFLTGKKSLLRILPEKMKPDFKIIGTILSLGISNFVMVSTESILSMCFTSSLARYGGDLAVGAMTINTSVVQLVTMPVNGIGQGGQPIISYNFGARKNDRVRQAFRGELIASLTFAIVCWGLIMLFPKAIVCFFTTDEQLIAESVWAIRIYMAGIFALGAQTACQTSFLGLGQAKISLLMACLRKLILLIPLIYILPAILQNDVQAVFLAEPVSDLLAAAVTTTLFFTRLNGILEKGPTK